MKITITADEQKALQNAGVAVEKLSAQTKVQLDQVKLILTKKIFPALEHNAGIQAAKARGINLEELSPGNVVLTEEGGSQFHGVIVPTLPQTIKSNRVQVWFPLKDDEKGITEKVAHQNILKHFKDDSYPISITDNIPLSAARQKLTVDWAQELI